VADFAQIGLISTLQRLNDTHLGKIEDELIALSREKSIALVLPCHATDLERPALAHIATELRDAKFLRAVVLSVNGIEADEFHHRFGANPPGPAGAQFVFNSPGGGKGRNVANAVALLCRDGYDVLVTQDCDVASFRRADLARLCYPIAHPELGFRYAKAYYSRVTDRLYGRVSRLFLAPLLHAIVRVAGHHPLVDFLLSFRYPLSGEVAMTRELAAELPFADGWGLEIGQLCEVFRRVDPRDVCQVDGGAGYDHKHQPAATALAKMAAEIVTECFWQLEQEGLSNDAAFRAAVAKAYRREAEHALRRSASLSRINALPFDIDAERTIVHGFAAQLDR
jgi:glucosyl-3-phosphoglycerate synthase